MNSQSWTIEKWCSQQEPSSWDSLGQASSIEFLHRLNLSSVHPFCNPLTAPNPYKIPGVPGQGPLLNNDHLETFWDVLVTIIAMGAPSLAAMAELWLRLFSSILSPLGVIFLALIDTFDFCNSSNHSLTNSNWFVIFACWISTASSFVLFTDTLYILEFGPAYGGTLLALSSMLSWKICSRKQLRNARWFVMGTILLAFLLIYDFETGQFVFGNPRDKVGVKEGLYFDGKQHRQFYMYY